MKFRLVSVFGGIAVVVALLFILLLATMMLPGIVTLIPTFILFKEVGWVDTFLPLVVALHGPSSLQWSVYPRRAGLAMTAAWTAALSRTGLVRSARRPASRTRRTTIAWQGIRTST